MSSISSYVNYLLNHSEQLRDIRRSIPDSEVENKKNSIINHITSLDLVFSFLLLNNDWLINTHDKIVLVIYYVSLRMDLDINYHTEILSQHDPTIKSILCVTQQHIHEVISLIKTNFKTLLMRTQEHQDIVHCAKNNTNSYLDYIACKNKYEKFGDKPIKLYVSDDVSDDISDVSSDTDTDFDNDSSSDFEMDEHLCAKSDNKDYSLFVDTSDQEEEDEQPRGPVTRSRSNKLNKEIMNSYKNKKRRRTNKKDVKTILNYGDIPKLIKSYVLESTDYDTPASGIHVNKPYKHNDKKVDSTNLTKFIEKKGNKHFTKMYDGTYTQCWEFKEEQTKKYNYIMFDKVWGEWFAFRNIYTTDAGMLEKNKELEFMPYEGYRVWKSIHVDNVIDIVMPITKTTIAQRR